MKKVAIAGSVLAVLAGLILFQVQSDDVGAPHQNGGNCGSYVLRFADPLEPDEHLDEQRCLVDAFLEGIPAELQVVSIGIDGRITDRYRVVGVRHVEVFHDSTQDPYSAQLIQTYRCLGLSVDEHGRPYHSGCVEA